MVLKNGEIANIDEIYDNIIGPMWKNQAQLLFNSARIGFNSKLNGTGVPNLKNIKYDVFNTDTSSSKDYLFYDPTNKYYSTTPVSENMTDYDAFSGASLDPVKWSWSTTGNGTLSVSGGTLNIGNSAAGGSAGSVTVTGLEDLRTIVGTYGVIKTGTATGTSYGIWTFRIIITDGTNSQNIYEVVTGFDNTTEFYYWIVGDTVYYKKTLGASWSSFSVSGWGTLKLKFTLSATGTSSGLVLKVDHVKGEVQGTPAEIIFQTTGLDTITDCIPTWNAEIDGDNTLTVSISADGTNYEEVTDATIHRFTNTGTNLFIKFEIDRVDTSAVDKISEYAILYNVGAS